MQAKNMRKDGAKWIEGRTGSILRFLSKLAGKLHVIGVQT